MNLIKYKCREPQNDWEIEVEAFDEEGAAREFAEKFDATGEYLFARGHLDIVEVWVDGKWVEYAIEAEQVASYHAQRKE